MGIVRQQWLLVILFAVVMVFTFAIAAAALRNAYSLADSRNWVSHSNDVNEAIRLAKQAFVDADLRGRLELVGLASGHTKDQLRAEALAQLEVIRALVADNAAQTNNLEEMKTAMIARFKTQDMTSTASVKDNNVVTIPLEQNINAIEALHRVEKAFNAIEVQEYALLRFRYAELANKESNFNNLFILLMVFSIIAKTIFAYFNYRALKRNRQGAQALNRDVLPITDNGKRKVIENVIKMLDEGVIID